jgi:hypothetical protein
MNEQETRKDPAEAEEALRQDLQEDKRELQQVSAFTVLGSVFRAWFGVQSEENRRRDFASNNPVPFIVAGIIFVLVMIAGVIIAVNLALSGAK